MRRLATAFWIAIFAALACGGSCRPAPIDCGPWGLEPDDCLGAQRVR